MGAESMNAESRTFCVKDSRGMLSSGFVYPPVFGIAVGRFDAEQMTHEEVLQSPLAVRATHAVASAGNHQKVNILSRFDQCVHKAHGRFRRDIVVHLADYQEQLAAQTLGVFNVRTLGILWPDWIAHPLLIPRSLVHAVVVTAA